MSIGNTVNPDVADNEYPTSDTSLAAYLFTEGYTINHIDHAQQRVVFIFANNSDKLQENIRLYHAGKAKVEPSLYLRNYRTLSRKAREGLQ